jgi:Domain of unknown function (DUF6321)
MISFKDFLEEKRGLWDNIHAKRERIKHGSGEHMRKPGSKGAPTAADFKASQATSKNEEVELEEGTFKYHMDKAVAAHMKGDSKKALYHLNNAKTARYAMSTKDYPKNKDLLDKYKKMTEEVEIEEDAKGYKNPTGGLTQKGRDHYNRETGGHLKAPVTTPPSELKKGSKSYNRRKSFCARMSGVKGPMKKPNGEPTRKALALRKWNC